VTEQSDGFADGKDVVDAREGRTLIKHSASIQITNRISFLARRISNVLLAYARRMPAETVAYEIHILDLRREIEYNSKNIEHLKSAIKSLAGTVVEYNIFDKDRGNEWGVFALLSQVKIKDNKVLYWYPPDIRDLLMSPNVYAKLDLTVQNKFSSKHSIALWEYLTDALGAKRSEAEILLAMADFRKLMSIDSREYTEFSDLSKRVINPAVAEINVYSKISVTLNLRRKGRTVEALLFGVKRYVAAIGVSEGQVAEQLANSNQNAQSELEPQDCGGHEVRDILFKRLIQSFGLKPAVAAKVLSEYSLDYVSENLDVVERIVGKGTVRNVAAYTIGALKTDYRDGSGKKGLDAIEQCAGQDAGRGIIDEEAQIAIARQWFEKIPLERQERVKELFIAELNVVQSNPVRDLYHRHGVDHPSVMRAFMLHVAGNLDKRRKDQGNRGLQAAG
jgi:hypothetical protein